MDINTRDYFPHEEASCPHCHKKVAAGLYGETPLGEGIFKISHNCGKVFFRCVGCNLCRKAKPFRIKGTKIHIEKCKLLSGSQYDTPENPNDAPIQDNHLFEDMQDLDVDSGFGEDIDHGDVDHGDPDSFLQKSSEDEWPQISASFFRAEHLQAGRGKKQIVCSAMLERGDSHAVSESKIDSMTSRECDYHLHLASVHLNATDNVSRGICTAMTSLSDQTECVFNQKIDACHDAYIESIVNVLTEKGFSNPQCMADQILKEAKTKYSSKVNNLQSQTLYNSAPDYDAVKRSYTGQKKSSLISRIPTPIVTLKDHCAEDSNEFTPISLSTRKRKVEHDEEISFEVSENKKRKYAHCSVVHIVNHLLVTGSLPLYFRAGYDSDWYHDASKQKYECTFIRDLHHKVKLEMESNSSIPKDTRVALLVNWSDGFENKKVAPNHEFNSLQLVTVTLLQDVRRNQTFQTLPYALTFKKKNHRDIMMALLREEAELRKPTLRLWRESDGSLKLYPTMIFVKHFANDLPERQGNLSLSMAGNNKNRHNRFGVSSSFDDSSTPSCQACDVKRINSILEGTHNIRPEPCEVCSDWQYTVLDVENFPIGPGEDTSSKEDRPVRLSFALLENALATLCDWIRGHEDPKKATQEKCKKYLDSVCLLGTYADEIAKQMKIGIQKDSGFDVTDCDLYPALLKEYKNLGIELYQYPLMPMHLFFLGIMKALIHETTRLFDKKRPQENRAWRDLVKFMKQCLNSINKLSVDWCLTMKFTGKDETDIGTAQWTSFHYVAFTRLSLYFFGYIDILLEREGIVEETKTGIKCFKKMILSFLVLVSYVFDPDFEPSCDVDQKIESYVRLFLTSCYHFDKNTRKESVRYDDDGEIVREESSFEEPKTNTNDGKATKTTGGSKSKKTKKMSGATKKSDVPFYISKPNFMSLLNLALTIATFGPLSGIWEGQNEAFIQHIKAEMGTVWHNEEFLMSVLIKMVRNRFFDNLNEGNQFASQRSKSRLSSVSVYAQNGNKSSVSYLQRGDPITGIRDEHGNLCVCIKGDRGRVSVCPLRFDDEDGRELFNMWYSGLDVDQTNIRCVEDRATILEISRDYFIAVAHKFKDGHFRYALICKSWKMRQKDGRVDLPIPLKDILFMK